MEITDSGELEYYNINNGMKLETSELAGYKHFDKSAFFEETDKFSITINDLQALYAKVTEGKKEHGPSEQEEQKKSQKKS